MLPAILGAVGSLASTFLGKKSADKANKAQAQQAQQNIALQKEFAQNGIQWKAADAKAAGINPHFAMGAPTTSFSPVSIGSTSTDFSGLSDMGQNIGRAVQASQSPNNKIDAYSRAAQAVQLEGLQLDNDIKRTQLASSVRLASQPGSPPGISLPGETPPYSIDGPTMKLQTNRDLSSSDKWTVPGSGPDVVMTNTSGGGMTWDTPPQLAESRESDFWMKNMLNFARNGLLPFANPHTRVPQAVIDALPSGTTPFFNPATQEWTAVRNRGRHLAIPYGFKQQRR